MSATRKVVINTCFGGFSLSEEATAMFAELKNISPSQVYLFEVDRSDADLVRVVEQLGKKANGDHAKLKVVEIPADVKWDIAEYDGLEHVEEVHRTWF
jgi:hypothetical protein